MPDEHNTHPPILHSDKPLADVVNVFPRQTKACRALHRGRKSVVVVQRVLALARGNCRADADFIFHLRSNDMSAPRHNPPRHSSAPPVQRLTAARHSRASPISGMATLSATTAGLVACAIALLRSSSERDTIASLSRVLAARASRARRRAFPPRTTRCAIEIDHTRTRSRSRARYCRRGGGVSGARFGRHPRAGRHPAHLIRIRTIEHHCAAQAQARKHAGARSRLQPSDHGRDGFLEQGRVARFAMPRAAPARAARARSGAAAAATTTSGRMIRVIQRVVPLVELLVAPPKREPELPDADRLKDATVPQLLEAQLRLHYARLLELRASAKYL